MAPISSKCKPSSHWISIPFLCLSYCPHVKPCLQPKSGSHPHSGSSEYGFEQGVLPQNLFSDEIRMNWRPLRGEARHFRVPSYLICLPASSRSQFRDGLDHEWRGVMDCVTGLCSLPRTGPIPSQSQWLTPRWRPSQHINFTTPSNWLLGKFEKLLSKQMKGQLI